MSAVRRLVLDHWKVVATFVAIFAAWEAAVLVLGVKPYILPKPSVVMTQMVARLPTVLDGALATLQPMLIGYVLAVAVGRAAGAPGRVLAGLPGHALPGDRLPPDRAEDRGRPALPDLVRLRAAAQGAAGLPAVVLPDRGQRGLGLPLGRPGHPRPCARHRRRSRAHLLEGAAAARAADPVHGLQGVGRAVGHRRPLVAEFVASDRGLGYLLVGYSNNMDTPMAFATILVISLMGLALYGGRGG